MFRNIILSEQLKKKLLRNDEIRNQEISIRDLFVYSCSTPYGEAIVNNTPHTNLPTPIRLTKHIETLANITHNYHVSKYYNMIQNENGPSFTLKKANENKITRLLLPEFSLYTSKPMTQEEFACLYNNILTIAAAREKNVHLLLSSMSVLSSDNQLLNMTCYVQCGNEPTIHTFCKANPSSVDIAYQNSVHFGQQTMPHQANEASVHITSINGVTISSNSVFIITTRGGAQYTQAIDVCLDHHAMHSKKLLHNLANQTPEFSSQILPKQVDHLVTSNSINIYNDAKIAPHITHIDPVFDIAQSDRPITTIVTHYFGANYKIVSMPERQLSGYIDEINRQIHSRNETIEEAFLISATTPQILNLKRKKEIPLNEEAISDSQQTKRQKMNDSEYDNYYLQIDFNEPVDLIDKFDPFFFQDSSHSESTANVIQERPKNLNTPFSLFQSRPSVTTMQNMIEPETDSFFDLPPETMPDFEFGSQDIFQPETILNGSYWL